MSNARTKPTPYRPARSSSRRGPGLWIALGVIVILAAVVAVFASREAETTTAAGIEETRPVAVTGAALAPMAEGTDPAVGQPAPLLRGASFDGTTVTIGGTGEGAVITFVAHWCPHCQAEVPVLSAHVASNPMPAGVDLLTVSTSTNSTRPNYPPSEWLEREDWPGPVLADSEDGAAAEAFGLTAFPYFVAVDSAGAVVGRMSGEITTEQFDQLTALAMGAVE